MSLGVGRHQVVAEELDADCLDPQLALALIRGLTGRADGQVLVVAAAAGRGGRSGSLGAIRASRRALGDDEHGPAEQAPLLDPVAETL